MKGTSQTEGTVHRNRFASREPVAWLAILALGITALLGWQFIERNRTAKFAARARTVSNNGAIDLPRKVAATRPIVTTVQTSSPAELRFNRQQAIDELTRQLNAKQRSKEDVQRVALMLARDGSDAAMQSLTETAASDLPVLQEIIADVLGQSTNAESGALLKKLLVNTNESVVVSAIRSLGQQGTPAAIADLSQLLYDQKRSVNVRAEAALGLGAIESPEVFATLTEAALQIQDEAVASQIVRAIAGRSLNETQSFLQSFLDAPQVSAELKAEALEGLSQTKGDPTSILLHSAKSDDPDVRAAAARSLGALETRGTSGAEILALLSQENDPLVRKRLYQALSRQESFDLGAAWKEMAIESDPAAKMAGLNLLGKAVQQSPSSEMIAFFDDRILPELKNSALNGTSSDERMASVMALRKARTAGANAALIEIAAQTTDSRLATAANRTPRREPRR